MSTFMICLIPIVYTAVVFLVGHAIGKYGSPVRWIGFRGRSAGTPTRVMKEYE
jgi:hypothetical protein